MSQVFSILQRKSAAILMLMNTSLLLTAGFASGATLDFAPVGAMLDVDAILDQPTAVGAAISFTVSLNTIGLAGPLNLTYLASWDGPALNLPGDANELSFTFINFAPGPFGGAAITAGNDGLQTITYAGLPAGVVGMLTVFDFVVQAGLVNDGLADFGIGFGTATVAGVNVIPAFNVLPQIVEVQPTPGPIAAPQPSTFVLFSTSGSLGILWYMWGKRRARSKESRGRE